MYNARKWTLAYNTWNGDNDKKIKKRSCGDCGRGRNVMTKFYAECNEYFVELCNNTDRQRVLVHKHSLVRRPHISSSPSASNEYWCTKNTFVPIIIIPCPLYSTTPRLMEPIKCNEWHDIHIYTLTFPVKFRTEHKMTIIFHYLIHARPKLTKCI